MSFCWVQEDGNFKILNPRACFQQIRVKARELFPQFKGKSLRALFEFNGFDATYCAKNHSIIGIEWSGHSASNVEEFFELIAPFVEKGSFLSFHGEDSAVYDYFFDGKTVKEEVQDADDHDDTCPLCNGQENDCEG